MKKLFLVLAVLIISLNAVNGFSQVSEQTKRTVRQFENKLNINETENVCPKSGITSSRNRSEFNPVTSNWKNCFGEVIYKNDEFYQGYFQNGQPSGLGKLTYSDTPRYYVGEFLDGLEHGYGVQKWNDGSIIYTGEWSNGKKWGKGFARLNEYSGNTLMTSDVVATCDCEWRNGEIINGVLTYLESGNVFEGSFEDRQPSKGKVTFKNGDIYKGEYIHWNLTGLGSLFLRIIIKANGVGTLEKADGTISEGTFKNGKLDGKGKKLNPDMSIQDGYFYDDEFLGSGEKGEQKYNSILDQEKKLKLEAQKKEQQRIDEENRAKAKKERKEKEEAKERARERQKRANIRNNCIIDLSKEVDMSIPSVERSVRDSCSEIADDPSWYERWKYE